MTEGDLNYQNLLNDTKYELFPILDKLIKLHPKKIKNWNHKGHTLFSMDPQTLFPDVVYVSGFPLKLNELNTIFYLKKDCYHEEAPIYEMPEFYYWGIILIKSKVLYKDKGYWCIKSNDASD